MKLLLSVFFIIMCFCGFGQSIESLREDIKRAEQEIKLNTELLEKNQKNQKLNLSQLKLIQSRIYSRKKIISSLQSQINLTNKDIDSKNSNIKTLTDDLNKLKSEYSQMVYTTYKNYKLNNFLVFLFASKDFNDVTQRIAFMKRYNKMRENKALEIDSLSKFLSSEVNELAAKLTNLDQMKTSHNKEVNVMGQDEKKFKTTASQLKSSESKLSQQVKAQQNEINKAQQRIQQIIAEEARKAKAQSSKQTVEEKQYDIQLTGLFDENKGKLPYPIRNGVIIDQYGVHAHPTQAGLTVNNKGINIAGESGASVHCVFEGEVTRIFFFKGLNNNVMVRHGNYITVYSNLKSVSVKAGDKVKLNQVLGHIASSENSDDHVLHFEIWKETTNLNPTTWLRR